MNTLKSNYSDLPTKSALRVVSYNITASFFDKPNCLNNWIHRAPHVKSLLRNIDADVIMLQEMSPEQASEIAHTLQPLGYKSFFLSQTPSDIEARFNFYNNWQISINLSLKSLFQL